MIKEYDEFQTVCTFLQQIITMSVTTSSSSKDFIHIIYICHVLYSNIMFSVNSNNNLTDMYCKTGEHSYFKENIVKFYRFHF